MAGLLLLSLSGLFHDYTVFHIYSICVSFRSMTPQVFLPAGLAQTRFCE